MKKTPTPPRPVHVIARAILDNWSATYSDRERPPGFVHYAMPYLRAMLSLETTSAKEYYGLEDAQMITLRFLDNIAFWRGPVARTLKAELNARLQYDNPQKGK